MAAGVMKWALQQSAGGPGPKTVLLVLAAHADAAGACHPSQSTIAAQAEMGVSTVRRHLESLAGADLIERVRRHRKNGSRASNGYVLKWRNAADAAANLPPNLSGSQPPNLSAGDRPDRAVGDDLPPKSSGRTDLPPNLSGSLAPNSGGSDRPDRAVGPNPTRKGGSLPPNLGGPTTFEEQNTYSSSSSTSSGQSRDGNGDEEDENGGSDEERLERRAAIEAMSAVVLATLTEERVPDEDLRRGLTEACRLVVPGAGREWQPISKRPAVTWSQRPDVFEQALTRVVSRTRVSDPLAELQRYVRYYGKCLLNSDSVESSPTEPTSSPAPDPAAQRAAADQRAEAERRLADELIAGHPDEAERIQADVDAEIDRDPQLRDSPGRKAARNAEVRRRVLAQLGGVRRMAGAA